jgi:hypothetical protein
MKRAAILIAFIVLATAAFAHQDRILTVRADGVIPELPPAYQTTRLHVFSLTAMPVPYSS